MSGKVIYLNAWLDCPDLILRRNYSLQNKINEARTHFFYKLREEGCTEERAIFLYKIWIQKNRKRIRMAEDEKDLDSPDNDLPPAS
jgi:hypothetical protein